MQPAQKVGLLVVAFIGLVFAAGAILEKSVFAKETETFYIEFPNAGGLQSGAHVLMAGVKIGAVTRVELMTVSKARAVVGIEKGNQIPKGTVAVLPTSFISIGDRQVELVPPPNAEKAEPLAPGSTIMGSLSSPLANVLPDSEKTVEELNKTLVAFRELLSDKELKDSIVGLMDSSERTVTKFGDLAENMDGMLVRNKDAFEGILVSTQKSLENMQSVSEEVKKLIESGDLQDRTVLLLDNLNNAVVSGQKLVAELNAMASDPEMRAALKDTMANVKTMSDSGTRIAANAETMAANGAVVSEEAVKLSKKANELADDVQKLIESFRGAVDRFKGVGTSGVSKVEVSADLVRESDPSRFRTDVAISVPIGEEKLNFGLYDAFEGNKLNLQISRSYNDYLALRYGVYASKPGIGVDYRLAPNLNARADLFSLNEPQLDLRLAYRLDERTNAFIGFDKIFLRPSPVLGIGIKK